MMKSRRGLELVNLNVYELKQKVRTDITHTFNFHTSINESETRSNIVKLLGINLDDFLLKGEFCKEVYVLKRNCTGVLGWKSLRELFYVLNETCKYVVLRTYDALPDNHRMDIHGDVDILVQDLPAFLNVLTPQTEKGDNAFRFFNWLNIGEQKILIHAKYVGDHYYDVAWEQRIIDTRLKNNQGIYVPSSDMQFWTLLYHGIFHKENYQKYSERFIELSKNLGIVWKDDKEYLCHLLSAWLIDNHYECQLHLDGGACALQTSNFRYGIKEKSTPVIYAYHQRIQGECYSITFVSENLIRDNEILFTSIVKPLDSLLYLTNNILRNDSNLYHQLVEREKQGELFWKYSIRLDDISEMVYVHRKGEEAHFYKRFLSGKLELEDNDIVCSEEKYISYQTGRLELDRLKELALVRGGLAFISELRQFSKEVFEKYATKDNELLHPLAWDAMPKNCFYTRQGQYYFFDLETQAKFPLKKSFYLAQLVRQVGEELACTDDEAKKIYRMICGEIGLTDIDYDSYIQEYERQVFNIIKNKAIRDGELYNYYFFAPIMFNKLITVPLEYFVAKDEVLQVINRQYEDCRERLLKFENFPLCKIGLYLMRVFRKLSL